MRYVTIRRLLLWIHCSVSAVCTPHIRVSNPLLPHPHFGYLTDIVTHKHLATTFLCNGYIDKMKLTHHPKHSPSNAARGWAPCSHSAEVRSWFKRRNQSPHPSACTKSPKGTCLCSNTAFSSTTNLPFARVTYSQANRPLPAKFWQESNVPHQWIAQRASSAVQEGNKYWYLLSQMFQYWNTDLRKTKILVKLK